MIASYNNMPLTHWIDWRWNHVKNKQYFEYSLEFYFSHIHIPDLRDGNSVVMIEAET